MATAGVPVSSRRFGETARRDLWWTQPLTVFIVFGSFVLYTTWASFQGEHYEYGPYLSPFYSPVLFGDSHHAWLGPSPSWWPSFLPYSPAFLILAIPAGFRVTCYYYRGAYYKAFWADPPSCTVGEPRSSYWGERSFPLVIQNLHRYFLYGALFYLPILSYDVWKGMWFTDATTGVTSFGIGIGTLVLAANTVLLAGYTFGCHSLRHIVGGRLDRISEVPLRKTLYACAGCFNRRHMVWAWSSLVSVAFADIYVRLCSMGVWSDFRIV